MACILVVDDDRAVLSTIKILLERDAHSVEAVDNGPAGLRLLEARPFDLLIVDIFMPGMDGFETISLVRKTWPEMPILVISGHRFSSSPEPKPDFLYMATKLGAISSLKKPFKPAEFRATITECLRGSSLPAESKKNDIFFP